MSARLVLRFLILAVLVAAAVFGFRYLFRATAIVTPVVRDTAIEAAPATVTVFADRTPEIRSEVEGRIETSNLERAKHVKAGEVLVELDPTELELQIKQISNDIAAAERRLEIGTSSKFELEAAQNDLERKRELREKNMISQLEVDSAERRIRQIEQKMELERAGLDENIAKLQNTKAQSEYRLSRMKIVSPIDGSISVVNAGTGDLIVRGSPIARLTSMERYVEAKISEENFAGVELGQFATVRFLQYGGMLYDAKVVKILPEADPQTQRFIVHLEVNIEPEKLIPGITGEASIVLDERENALVIPRSAVVGQKVFVVENGVVKVRDIELGYTSLNLVEVLSGLEEGELVIVDEVDRFRRGDRVAIEMLGEEQSEG